MQPHRATAKAVTKAPRKPKVVQIFGDANALNDSENTVVEGAETQPCLESLQAARHDAHRDEINYILMEGGGSLATLGDKLAERLVPLCHPYYAIASMNTQPRAPHPYFFFFSLHPCTTLPLQLCVHPYPCTYCCPLLYPLHAHAPAPQCVWTNIILLCALCSLSCLCSVLTFLCVLCAHLLVCALCSSSCVCSVLTFLCVLCAHLPVCAPCSASCVCFVLTFMSMLLFFLMCFSNIKKLRTHVDRPREQRRRTK